MSNENRNYYLLPEGHEAIQVIEDFNAERRATRSKWHAFRDKFGAQNTVSSGGRICGLVFEDCDPPEDWYTPKGYPAGSFKPYANRKNGREAFKELNKLPIDLTGFDISNRLSKVLGTSDGMTGTSDGSVLFQYTVFEMVGDRYLLNVPKTGNQPRDLQPLKMSEYWKMKEAAAA